uniref:PIR Superfamily Protein n=1 Tax=Strongyloides venezuelensis TaxID=75913 RepID=A0A0K0EUP0_STRVS
MKLDTNHNYGKDVYIAAAFLVPLTGLMLIYITIYWIVRKVKSHFRKRYEKTKKIPLVDRYVGLDLEEIRLNSYSEELPSLVENISILDTSCSVTHSSSFRMLENLQEKSCLSTDPLNRQPDLDDLGDIGKIDEKCDIMEIDGNSTDDDFDVVGYHHPLRSQYNKKNN